MKCIRCGSLDIQLTVDHGVRKIHVCEACLRLLVREFVQRKEDVDELKVS